VNRNRGSRKEFDGHGPLFAITIALFTPSTRAWSDRYMVNVPAADKKNTFPGDQRRPLARKGRRNPLIIKPDIPA
jgi:hypothetical protein